MLVIFALQVFKAGGCGASVAGRGIAKAGANLFREFPRELFGLSVAVEAA